ncbi:MAG: CHASE domain-containing protein, partial [Oligoflexia bacterium]|nr:CHASE domain-containing protein [Oligoflexia bacterium]
MKAFSRAPLARSPLTALLVLLVSLTLAAFGAVMTARYFHAETEARFEQRSRVIQDAISYGMNSYVNLLVHSAGVFVASRDVSREEFRNFVRSIQLRERYPGIQGIGYVPIVKAKELASHTRRAREAGLPDYEVRDFRNTQGNIALPRKPEDNRYPIYYLEPMDAENRLAIGMDFATERRRKVAMERARDSGQPAVTETILLVQDKNQPEGRQEPSFLIFYPVYEPGMPTATIEQRRRAVR